MNGGGPLSGVRVVDVSTSYAGPTATMYLGDMGADVIKVERPETGDDARLWGPPFVGGKAGGESAWFLSANRNKRSVCLDLSTEKGLAALLRLLDGADVFVENINPAKLEKRGLDPGMLRARFPRLIYCALSGFGLDGPDRARPGYDLIAQARSGLMSVTGAKGGTPQRVSTALSDVVAGMVAAFAVAAALVRQQSSGEGELVDVSLLDADLALMAPRVASFLAGEPEPRPSGGTDSVLAVYQPFETADRPIVVAVGNDKMWQRFCDTLGLEKLRDDPGLATNAARRERRGEILEQISVRLREHPADYWLGRLGEAAVPCQTVQTLSEVVEDPQVVARRAISETTHPLAGTVRAVGSPWRLGADGAERKHRPAPVLGADTVEVLREAGYADEEVDELLKGGAAWASATRTP
jgi:crotonobetainyl-CoA:carnitine CoA-transferase CaiB-like acyl-CoA transferase